MSYDFTPVLSRHPFPSGSLLWGLVVDSQFAIAVGPLSRTSRAGAAAASNATHGTYAAVGLIPLAEEAC